MTHSAAKEKAEAMMKASADRPAPPPAENPGDDDDDKTFRGTDETWRGPAAEDEFNDTFYGTSSPSGGDAHGYGDEGEGGLHDSSQEEAPAEAKANPEDSEVPPEEAKNGGAEDVELPDLPSEVDSG